MTVRSLLALALAAGLTTAPSLAQPTAPTADYAIPAPPGVDDEQFVRLGGVEQWVTIRGRDRANPVLVIVGGNGGPTGASMTPFVGAFLPWERDFTIVQWDHRGAGKSFVHNGKAVGPDLTFDQLTADGLALVDYVRARLGKDKVVLLGVSYGSTVAVKMIKARPQLFSAYVAAGQVIDARGGRRRFYYDRVVRLATERGDTEGLKVLREVGPEPATPEQQKAYMAVAVRYRPPNPTDQAKQALEAPHWSLDDVMSIPKAGAASDKYLWPAWQAFDFSTLEGRIPVPVIMITGADNDIDPTPMAKAWLERIQAPKKVFAPIPVAGNHAMETHGAEFLRLLDQHVRPLAIAADRKRYSSTISGS